MPALHTAIAGREAVTQEELDKYLYLQNRIEELKKNLMRRIANGASIEEGIHCARIQQAWKHGKFVQKLKVR